ncbi:LamG domain-containing protein [bacterium]|nr:LamG domain-containing protein [bacterium]
MRNSLFAILAIVLSVSFITAEELSLPDLNVNYKLKASQIKLKFYDEPTSKLQDKYKQRLETLKSQYSKKGLLGHALAAKESITLAPTKDSIEKYSKFKEISEVHKIFVETANKIEKKYEEEAIKILKVYLNDLEELKIEETKKENLELASLVQRQIESVKKGRLYKTLLSFMNKELAPPAKFMSLGLVAYYPFNGSASDESINNNHAIVNGPILINDRHGRSESAYFFDGENDLIQIRNSSHINFTSEMTISFWLKPNSSWGPSWSGTSGIISKLPRGDRKGYVIYHDNTKREKINFRSIDGLGVDYNVTKSKAVSEKWDHWVLVYDSGGVFWFKNGSIDVKYNLKSDWAILRNLSPLYIGHSEHWNNGFSTYFGGSIDDIRMYNRALSFSEISDLYEYEKPSSLNKFYKN